MAGAILAIDQGTTSTRSIVFGADLAPVASAQEEFTQHFPAPGWVEHDAEDLWRTALSTAKMAIDKAGIAIGDIAAIGIANQRESVVMWDRASGKPIANAIVWQDRRTADICTQLEADGHGDVVAARTGLRIDPYFSATKIAWMLDNVAGARRRAEDGQIAFGTVETFLLWRLTAGAVHATDATNASRTLLYDISTGTWDDDMLRLFNVPRAVLPEVRDCASHFGTTATSLFGKPIDIRGMAGDQQAALIGQACFRPGMVKSTYGTGCFMLRNLGAEPLASRHGLVTTVAYQFGGRRTFALEGSIFAAGSTVQWLRDGLGVVASAAETEALAEKADPEQQIYLVPAFTGLGAPYWAPHTRATISGITRGTTRNELARAALESVAYQSRDLLEAMTADAGRDSGEGVVRVDGGLSANGWAMQFLADMLGAPVERPAVVETSARGAAYLAGHDVGLYPPPESLADSWRPERRFEPQMNAAAREEKYAGWQRAITQTLAT